ncbi:hypothetical protein TRFO_39246 [Tritrichomonas foetus]|uniref:RING-type domain-containing protein n=1 Tax=Tritrichomonas foetus TaxID=1144522 RepID=A0A1J4JBE9_9EUKA|nr:hypothetical protein TRFO_39246 [Tritrichomonas foetus]|eukprot:OHS94572.1 hypothetical protein TRFO_39246 [Tritrichomonas foetus]
MNRRQTKKKIPILKQNKINYQHQNMVRQNQIVLPKSPKRVPTRSPSRSPPRTPKNESVLPQCCINQYSKLKNVTFNDLYGQNIESYKSSDLPQINLPPHPASHLAQLDKFEKMKSNPNQICNCNDHSSSINHPRNNNNRIYNNNLQCINDYNENNNQNLNQTIDPFYIADSQNFIGNYNRVDFNNKKTNIQNNDYGGKCPICHDRFGVENIVVLSCGHTIHATCLMSFRRFSRQQIHKCPVCQQAYQFVEMKAEMEHHNRAALQIQRVFRGFIFRRHLMDFVEPGSLLHRRWILSRAEKASTRLASAIEDQSDAVDAILASIDKELDWARNVMNSVEIKEKEIDWATVKDKSTKRWNGECPICLREIKKNECSVTSCCHTFHTSCITSWVSYCQKAENPVTCPVCRSAFQHQPLNSSCIPKLDHKIFKF